jgi:hypothetical protein
MHCINPPESGSISLTTRTSVHQPQYPIRHLYPPPPNSSLMAFLCTPEILFILLITFAALLHSLVYLFLSSCPFLVLVKVRRTIHTLLFVVYDPKGVALSDVDCPRDKRQIQLTIPNSKARNTCWDTDPIRLYQTSWRFVYLARRSKFADRDHRIRGDAQSSTRTTLLQNKRYFIE